MLLHNTELSYNKVMKKNYTLRGITSTTDPDLGYMLVFYRVDDGEGWTEYETAVWDDNVSEYWTPATMSQTNLLWTVVGEDAEKFHRLISKIAGGGSCEVEQN